MDLEQAARRLNDHAVVEMRSPGDVFAAGRRARRRRTTRIVSSATVVAALVVAAVVVGTRSSTQHHSVTIVATTPPPAARGSSNEVHADRLAAVSLDEIALPPGSTRWTAPPPAVIARPSQVTTFQPSIARHRIWRVPVSHGATVHFLHEHPPTGAVRFTAAGTGSALQHGVMTVFFLEYDAITDNTAITELRIGISIADRGPHGAWLRADVQVVYRPERPADEYVSAHDVVVRISQTSLDARDERKPPSPTVVVTDPTDVRRLRDAINGLRTVPVGPINCPALSGNEPEYILVFQRSATSAPDLVATTQNFCVASTGVSVHGKSRPILEAGDLPTLAANLLQRVVARRH